MKYPPYSWLRLTSSIRKNPSRMWFAFSRLPKPGESCHVKVHIGTANNSIADPFDALQEPNILFPRQHRVLERFLKRAKPTKKRGEFLLDHAIFSTLLPYCSAVPFEVIGQGVVTQAKQNARIKASLNQNDPEKPVIEFSLVKASNEPIQSPIFYSDVNALVIDKDLRLYSIVPYLTQSEAETILYSPPLPLLGLAQKNSREMFYALSRLGIDFSCLNQRAVPPAKSQIVLRLLLSLDDLTKKMCARAHLVTQIADKNFSDEVEIPCTGSLASVHIRAEDHEDEEKFLEDIAIPTLLKRPTVEEQEARNFLFHLGAGPARHHNGFELSGNSALELLKNICHQDKLPKFIALDEHARPEIIELFERPKLILRAEDDNPARVFVTLSLGEKFDACNIEFTKLSQAKDNILVIDEDTLVVFSDEVLSSVSYFAETFGLKKPGEEKSKSVAQIALLLNSLGERIEIDCPENLRDYLDRFSVTTESADTVLPKGLITTLRPYQHEAVSWLSSLARSGLGGLLGDEMGLGKTLMILSHLAKMKELGKFKPALVVCPTSVIDVWHHEAGLHIPSLRVLKWHGPDRFQFVDALSSYDIVITSYALLRRDIDSHLGNFSFSTFILDEAQYVRNQQTDSFRSAKNVRCNHRIALTGTPIENHVSDLFNILDCVEEGILGNRSSFEKRFANPIEAGEKNSAVTLKMLLAPVVTRRKKTEVEHELPPKIENIVNCELSHDQRVLYSQYLSQLHNALGQELSVDKSSAESHFALLSALTRLRQICCHPSLLLGKEGQESSSGKIDALREIMSECLEMGRKIIIYSQFLKMQEHIVRVAQEIQDKPVLWLHGSSKNRQEIIQTFQKPDGPSIIVVSLKAGGTGITLTEADTVIFADPWWNPAVEDQAIDRAHRIGQQKTVHVIRLIAENSIEGEVVALADKKRKAAQSVLHGGFSKTANLTREEVRSLLLQEVGRLKNQD